MRIENCIRVVSRVSMWRQPLPKTITNMPIGIAMPMAHTRNDLFWSVRFRRRVERGQTIGSVCACEACTLRFFFLFKFSNSMRWLHRKSISIQFDLFHSHRDAEIPQETRCFERNVDGPNFYFIHSMFKLIFVHLLYWNETCATYLEQRRRRDCVSVCSL